MDHTMVFTLETHASNEKRQPKPFHRYRMFSSANYFHNAMKSNPKKTSKVMLPLRCEKSLNGVHNLMLKIGIKYKKITSVTYINSLVIMTGLCFC